MSTRYQKLGKYDVLDVIGRGGMGVIYKATDPGIGRIVAIKMMTGAFVDNPELLQRFYREAQSAGKLQHPNIVTIYDLGVQDGNPYLVMEFLEGESLELAIKTRRPLLLEEKLNIVIEICNGLGYAHRHHIVHRDIKPANIMLLKDGGVKIVDFGIARIGDEGMTRPGQMMGSFQYMSPEQINSAGNVDTRSDIFSVGVLLFQLLTATLPFEGKDTGETLLKILHEAPPPLSRFLPASPAELNEIVQRVLAKDREQRYQAAEDLAFDLTHVQEQLKRGRILEYLEAAENSRSQGQLSRAKEQLLQVLRLDRQNSRANELLREVQQQIQKKRRSEQARELQAEAEKALARGELETALAYLEKALALDNNPEMVRLCESVREKKARSDKLRELLQRAEMAQDAGDLDEASLAIEEALVIDTTSTEVRSLHAVISREIAERDKQLQLQKFMGEARKQISSRRFTAALEVLKQAESMDPTVPGIQELINLAATGQQQEQRRNDLDRLTTEIEDALNRDDYVTACAKAEAGLRNYPDDRGLSKLKAVAERQREASEKRSYIEGAISRARRLLEQSNSEEALLGLRQALEKYPAESALQSMIAMVTESIERERTEQKKVDVIQKAKDAIRRKSYDEAMSILEAARHEIGSSEFDDLLQFAQEEAGNYARRQKVDAVAEQAHRLSSEEKYEQAIDLLEATLREVPDQELEIILADIRRHVEDFKNEVEDAIATASRLLRQERYGEAVKFLEGKDARYAKSQQFSAILQEARQQQQFVQALSLAKEEVREAIDRSDLEGAQQLWQRYRPQLGEAREWQLLAQQIAAKRTEVANAALEMALRDARMLLTVQSFDSALNVLQTVASQAPNADPELRENFIALQETARAVAMRHREQKQEKSVQEIPAVDLEQGTQGEATLSPLPPASLEGGRQGPPADTVQLQTILGQVTLIADRYRDADNVQRSIDGLKQQITSRISALREAELSEAYRRISELTPPKTPPPAGETVSGAAGGISPGTQDFEPANAGPSGSKEATTVHPEYSEAAISVATPPFGITQSPEALTSLAGAEATIESPVEEPPAEPLSAVPPERPTPDVLAAPPSLSVAPELQGEAEIETPAIADGSALEAALLEKIEEEDRLATLEPPPAPVRLPEPPAPSPAKVPAPQPSAQPKPASRPRPAQYQPQLRPPASAPKNKLPWLIGAVALVALVIGLSLYFVRRQTPPASRMAQQAPAPALVQPNPIALQQQAALDAAGKLQAADDLEGARRKLLDAAGLNGPLNATIKARLDGIEAAMKDQKLHVLRRNEEQLWQRATRETDEGKFQLATRDFQKILGLGEGAERKTEAQHYLQQVIPVRQKEEALFAQAEQTSRANTAATLQQATRLLDQVIALNGPRKSAAQDLRDQISSKMQTLSRQDRNRQIVALQSSAESEAKAGNFATAREKVAELKQLGVDTTALSARIDQMEKAGQANAAADRAFGQAVQLFQQAANSKDKAGLNSALDQFQQIAQAGGKHAGEARNYAAEANKALASLQPPAPPKLPTASADQLAVRAALDGFNAAYEHGQPNELKTVWPSAPKKYTDFMQERAGYAFAMALHPRGATQITGNTAVVPCDLVSTTTKPGGKTQHTTSVNVLLQKAGDRWLILDPLRKER